MREKRKSRMTAMQWFYSYLKKYRWKVVSDSILVTATSVLAIVNPKITGFIVDDIIGDGTDIKMDLLPKFLGLMIAGHGTAKRAAA
jgi:ATP-binding cassette subfamily B protein